MGENKGQQKSIDTRDQQAIKLKAFLAEGEVLDAQLPFYYADYLLLVNWSGRAIRDDKSGAIDTDVPGILRRLHIDKAQWIKAMQPKGNHAFSRAMGCCNTLRAYAKKLQIAWIKGVGTSLRLFPYTADQSMLESGRIQKCATRR